MTTLLDQTAARLNRLPFFSVADYGLLNADLPRSVDYSRHALLHGCGEGRQIFKADRLARAWGQALQCAPAATGIGDAAPVDLPTSAAVYISTWSDPAAKDLAEALLRDLTGRGIAAEIRTERTVPVDMAEPSIVVAPHDFFRLGLGRAWRGTALARSCLMLNTAAPTSQDFSSALPYLLVCRGILDLSPQVVAIFLQAGVPACTIRPSFPPRERWLETADAEHPLVHALPPAARPTELELDDARPIDVSALGVNTAWRGACLARLAAELAEYRTFFHFRHSAADLIERSVLDRAQFRIAGHVAARSKLALQITETEIPCFDWHAALQAMAAGAVVVTNRAAPHDAFEVGTHVFQEDSRHLPDLIAWLLKDPEGRAASDSARASNRAILSDPCGAEAWVDRAAAMWGAT